MSTITYGKIFLDFEPPYVINNDTFEAKIPRLIEKKKTEDEN